MKLFLSAFKMLKKKLGLVTNLSALLVVKVIGIPFEHHRTELERPQPVTELN
jgi:hypothetical protein